MQGVIKSYDPGSGDGVVLCDTDLAEYDLDADAYRRRIRIVTLGPGHVESDLLCDSDFREYDLAADCLVGSVFRMLRQGQRVIFDLTSDGLATHLRLGSEVDMGTPGFPPAESSN